MDKETTAYTICQTLNLSLRAYLKQYESRFFRPDLDFDESDKRARTDRTDEENEIRRKIVENITQGNWRQYYSLKLINLEVEKGWPKYSLDAIQLKTGTQFVSSEMLCSERLVNTVLDTYSLNKFLGYLIDIKTIYGGGQTFSFDIENDLYAGYVLNKTKFLEDFPTNKMLLERLFDE